MYLLNELVFLDFLIYLGVSVGWFKRVGVCYGLVIL